MLKFVDGESVTCNHHRNDDTNQGDLAINAGDCTGSGVQNAHLFGCTLKNNDGAGSEGTYNFDSTTQFADKAPYPITIDASLEHCTSETGDIGDTTTAVS